MASVTGGELVFRTLVQAGVRQVHLLYGSTVGICSRSARIRRHGVAYMDMQITQQPHCHVCEAIQNDPPERTLLRDEPWCAGAAGDQPGVGFDDHSMHFHMLLMPCYGDTAREWRGRTASPITAAAYQSKIAMVSRAVCFKAVVSRL